MDKIIFKEQPGRIAPELVIMTNEITKRALIKSLYNEAQINGKDLILKDVELDDAGFLRSVTFGLGDDSSQEGIIQNSVFPTFFVPARDYSFLILRNTTNHDITLSGGITPNGSELFSAQVIAASSRVPILVTLSPSVITPFFLWSANWNGASINVKTISDPAS
jgi:hypothetical protein